jgi:hypothetical protein
VLASAGGLLLGILLSASRELLDLYVGGRDLLDSLLGYSTLGAGLGLAQWLVLRRWSPRAHWWILVNLLGWTAGWALAAALAAAWSAMATPMVQVGVPALVAGLAGGLTLGKLLPRSSA